MIRLSKEDSDRMVLNILSELSKVEGKEFAEQSLKIMDNPQDNTLLTGVLMNKARPSIFSEEEQKLSTSLIEILGSFFYTAKCTDGEDFQIDLADVGISEKLINTFTNPIEEMDEDSYFNNLYQRMKIKFAVSQFVIAFMEYERMENKYPNVMNFMDGK